VTRLSFVQRMALSFGAAGLLLVTLFVLGGVDPADVLRTLTRLSPGVYGLALALHVATTALRAVRFQLLIPRSARPSFRHALPVAAAHNMASYVLPLKTGEAALIVYLRLQCGTPAGIALASLLVSRFLDGAALCTGLAVACASLLGEGAAPEWMESTVLVLSILAGSFLLLSLRGDLLLRGLAALLRVLGVQRTRLGQGLLERTHGLALALRSAGDAGRLALAVLATAPMWFTVFGFYALLAGEFGIPAGVGFLERALAASLSTLFNLLPVNAAAGAGTQELGWVTGFHVILGVDEKLALTSGLGVHLVQLFNIVLMGLAAHLVMGMLPRWRRPDSAGSA